MSEYRPTIGLEIHAELATRTKMFCDCANDPEAREPNTNVCPVCMAHPGTIPVANKEAVRQVLRVGTSLNAKLSSKYSEFDRKSYFYPDIPKGYQISQFEYPFVQGGTLANVDITRIHLEEDTARSSHGEGVSLVDFNRAGVPLMELVTEPVIHDGETAGVFARELQLLLRTLGASHANLEKGEMRVEANISVSKSDTLGTKVEVKNLNSFRSVERAIAYEIDRQEKLLDEGGMVVQETRGWDEGGQKTFSQRIKEGSADYRYFPEPDLPKLSIDELPEFTHESLKASLPELPWERRARYESWGLRASDVEYVAASLERATFFDAVTGALEQDATLMQIATNYFVSDLAGLFSKGDGEDYTKIHADAFAKLVRMIGTNEISSRGAKDILAIMITDGGDAETIAQEKGLTQESDPEALRTLVKEVLAQQTASVEEYRAGKESVLQFLVGQGMKASKGAGNPQVIKELLIEELAKK